MGDKRRDRFFGAFVRLGTRRPGAVLAVFSVLVVLSLALASRLEIQTSRFSLVAADNPYQSRLLTFFDRFGQPDAPVFVVAGGEAESRRVVIDIFVEELEASDDYRHRTLARVGPGQVAEIMFLQRPEALTEVRASVPEDTEIASHLERGLPGIVDLLTVQIDAGIDGTVQVDPARADEGLTRMVLLADVLDQSLAGEEPADAMERVFGDELSRQAEQDDDDVKPLARGVDEKGYLVGRKGTHHIVAVFPDLDGTEVADYRDAVADLRQRRDRALSRAQEQGITDVEILATGLPVLTVDEEDVLRVGLFKSSIATGAGIFLLLLIAFRSLRQAVVALIPMTLGSLLSLGALSLLFGHLNTITSGYLAVLMGLGIDFCVHIINRSDESLRAGADGRTALRDGFVFAGPGVVTGAVTSALAFLTISLGEFTAFGEMAVISCLGLLLTLMATIVVLPVLQGFRLGALERHRDQEPKKVRAAPPPPGVRHLPRVMRAAPRVVLVLGLVFAVAGGAAFGQIDFNGRYFDFLPQETESARALNLLERDGAMSPLFAFVQAEGIEDARAKAELLREMDTVGVVQSPSDLLPPLTEDGRADKLRKAFADVGRDPDFSKFRQRSPTAEELKKSVRALVDSLDGLVYELEGAGRPTAKAEAASRAFTKLEKRLDAMPQGRSERLASLEAQSADLLERAWTTARRVSERGEYRSGDLPALFRHRNAARDGTDGVALYVYPEQRIWDGDMAQRFSSDVESVDALAAGHAISMHHHNEMILADFTRATLISLGLVLAILMFDFRRITDTLLALLPVAVGWAWMIGLLALFGIRFNVANIVVLPLLLGIGIDSGVHMVHRCRQSAQDNGGTARLEDLVEGTGSAVVLSSVTTMVGFGGLMVSDYGGMVSLGSVMVLGIGCCIFATIFVLPALLLAIGRAR